MLSRELDRDEIQRLNEEIFKEEQERASDCPYFGHGNHYTCDGCNIIEACSSIPTEY